MELRSERLMVRLKPSELRAMDAAAEAAGLRRSEILRRAVEGVVRRILRAAAPVRAV